jgi:hypothetical protein
LSPVCNTGAWMCHLSPVQHPYLAYLSVAHRRVLSCAFRQKFMHCPYFYAHRLELTPRFFAGHSF